MKTVVFLTAWIALILIPFHHGQGQPHPLFEVLTFVFRSDASRILAHFTLFAVLSFVLTIESQRRFKTRLHLKCAILCACAFIGLGQEGLQSIVRENALMLDSIFDIGVDLTGAWFGTFIENRHPLKETSQGTSI